MSGKLCPGQLSSKSCLVQFVTQSVVSFTASLPSGLVFGNTSTTVSFFSASLILAEEHNGSVVLTAVLERVNFALSLIGRLLCKHC